MLDTMKKVLTLTILCSLTLMGKAQGVLSLDSCRALALANNKDLLISNEKINAAHYQRKAAFTNYLPSISATGAYMRNQKEFSLLNDDHKAALSGLESGRPYRRGGNKNRNCIPRSGSTRFFTKWEIGCSFARTRQSRKFDCRCFPYRYKKRIRRSYYSHPTFIYGWKDSCLQQNH